MAQNNQLLECNTYRQETLSTLISTDSSHHSIHHSAAQCNLANITDPFSDRQIPVLLCECVCNQNHYHHQENSKTIKPPQIST